MTEQKDQKPTGQERALMGANQQVAELKRRLEIKKDEIQFLLGDNVKALKLMMSALMRASDDAKVRECEPNSIVRAVIQAALCGADLLAGLGEGYLVPYFNKDLGVKECQFMPGYRLGQRNINEATGLRVVADVVCAKDHWRYSQVPLVVEHTPSEEADRGPMLRSYAVLLGDDGRVMFCQIATAKDIEQAKLASRKGRDQDSPAWRNWEDRMWRKVAIMRLAKEVRAWKPTAHLSHTLEADAVSVDAGASLLIGSAQRELPPGPPAEGRAKVGSSIRQPESVPVALPASEDPETGEVPPDDQVSDMIRIIGLAKTKKELESIGEAIKKAKLPAGDQGAVLDAYASKMAGLS